VNVGLQRRNADERLAHWGRMWMGYSVGSFPTVKPIHLIIFSAQAAR